MNSDALPSALQQRKVRDLLEAERWIRAALTDEPSSEALQPNADYADTLAKDSTAPSEGGIARWWNILETGADALRDLFEPPELDEEEFFMWTVVLSRSSSQQKWGFKWNTERLYKFGDRVLDSLQPGSIAECWNQQETARGELERCLRANDKLVSANGRTDPHDIKKELQKKEVVLEFRRAAPEEAAADSSSSQAEPSRVTDSSEANEAVPGASADSASTRQIPMFQLSLQLADERTELFEFQVDADIDRELDEFAQRIKLNTMFRDPLLAHAMLMLQTGRHEDSVDVVDLM